MQASSASHFASVGTFKGFSTSHAAMMGEMRSTPAMYQDDIPWTHAERNCSAIERHANVVGAGCTTVCSKQCGIAT